MNRRAWGIVTALFYILLWASAFIPSKIGVLGSSPLWFLVVRFLVSGGIALAVALALRAPFPLGRRDWTAAIVVGICNNAVYLGCTYEALRHLAAGVGAIVASLNPLILALVAPFLLQEPLTRGKLAGLLLGFGGVLAIMLERAGSGTAEPADVALAFLGVVGGVAGTIVYKKYCTGLDLRSVTAIQLLAAGILLLPAAVLFEGAPHVMWSTAFVVSFIYVVLVMSIGASLLWFWLLRRGDASRVSAYYFLTPVFGLALAALLLQEPVGVRDIGGLVAITAGIFLVQRG